MQRFNRTRLAILIAAGAFACADPISAPRSASSDGLSLAATSNDAQSFILVASTASLRPGLAADIAKAGGVFKATVGLYEEFGPLRVRDTGIGLLFATT